MSEALKVWDKLLKDDSMIPSDKMVNCLPIPTPSPSINWALEGGVVPGRIYCYEGPEASGKSFFAMETIKELLKSDPNGVIVWYDAEMSFSFHWRDILIPPEDHNRILVRQKNVSTEIFDHFSDEVMDIVQNKGGKVLGCVIDSLQSIIPPREKNATSTGDHVMGDLSQYMPKALRRILSDSRRYGIPWIIISQVRENLDPQAKYTGRKYVVSGGMAFRHAIDAELLFEKVWSKDSRIYGETKGMNDMPEQLGHTVRVKVMKNRVGQPHRVAEFKLHNHKGIVDIENEILHLAKNLGVITIKGSNYYFNDQLIAAGREKTAEMIASSNELKNSIMAKVMETKSSGVADSDDIMLTEAEDELEMI